MYCSRVTQRRPFFLWAVRTAKCCEDRERQRGMAKSVVGKKDAPCPTHPFPKITAACKKSYSSASRDARHQLVGQREQEENKHRHRRGGQTGTHSPAPPTAPALCCS
jgi:hypothetical protein